MNKIIYVLLVLGYVMSQASELGFANVEEVGVEVLTDEKRNKWYADSFKEMKELHTLLFKNIIPQSSITISEKVLVLKLWQNLMDGCEDIYLYGSYYHRSGEISKGETALDEWNAAYKTFEELYGAITIKSFLKKVLDDDKTLQSEDFYFPKITEIVYEDICLEDDSQESTDTVDIIHSY